MYRYRIHVFLANVALWPLAFLIALGSTVAVAQTPVISSISPSSVVAGSTATTLTVMGSGFTAGAPGVGSFVNFNGNGLSTTYVSSTKLTAVIPPNDLVSAGSNSIQVFNTWSLGSNVVTFNVTSGNPVPAITSLSPSSATAGGIAFTLTVNGSNFVSSSVVHWGSTSLSTTYVSAMQLHAAVPASDIASAATVAVTVINPTPGGGTSNSSTFTIAAAGGNPVPAITSLSPSSTTAGGIAFTLTVNGSNFVSSSIVHWGSTSLSTTYVSATQLHAAVPASDIASAATVAVTVVNPTPGGGTSNSSAFTIAAAGVPSAVTDLHALATMEGAILTFAAPSSNGGAALNSYTATATPGGATASISAITSPVNGLSARIYFPDLTAGTSYTFTVRAENANGLGAVSTTSNAVTPTAYAEFYVLNGSEAAGWNSYSYGGTFTGGVAPGAVLTTNHSGVKAPANWSGGTGVYEVDISSAYGAALLYVEHTNPSNAGNGRFSLAPFTNVVIKIFPTYSSQVVNTYFYKSIWLNGVATAAGSTSVLTDATQDWAANQFLSAGWSFNDNASGHGIVQTAVDGNTATTVTFNPNGGPVQEGDLYELQQPDQSIGTSITLPNSAYGPGTMTAGEVNTWTIPLSAFGVTGQEILKFAIQDQTGGSQQTWWVSYDLE